MRLLSLIKNIGSQSQQYLQVFAQQAAYLQHASAALLKMTESTDLAGWKKLEKEVKVCEVQGDALLTEFHEQLYGLINRRVKRSDLQAIAMNIDDFLDHINDSAKSIPLYVPKRIDPQICDLAQYIAAEADAIRTMVSYFDDIRRHYAKISVQCERITELEHAADDTFADYIGYIFTKESDPIELIKYKNIAETLEATTDAAKRVSDRVRKIIMRYAE